VTAPPIRGAQAGQDAAADWQAVLADRSIQFAPVNAPPKPPETPCWIKALREFLRDLFEPIGQALGFSWPVMQWVLAAIGLLAVGYLLWRLAEPWLERARTTSDTVDQWIPEREQALALLSDADRLAAEGRFDAATHLLLQRSIAQIAAARPDWVLPASTAREIAATRTLPERARQAFAAISARVERSRFALCALNAEDWQAARAAYAEFALERLPIAGGGA
jgi:hypothetical protein